MSSKSVVERIYNHPDREELIGKLLADTPVSEISEWLNAKYEDVKELQLSTRMISEFKKNNLDFYTIMKTDLATVRQNKIDPQTAITAEIQNNSVYKAALTRYANSEVDVKRMINNLCAAIEFRFEQVFNELQGDISNFKFDRILIEYAGVLKDTLKECNDIVNGPEILNQTNIQNNINIQVVENHSNMISDIIREILSMLDYDTSIKFMELYNERMMEFKKVSEATVVIAPVENRLADAKQLTEKVESELDHI